MSSTLVLLLLHAGAPIGTSLSDRLSDAHSRVSLLASSEAKEAHRARIAQLDEQIRQAPSGWPVGATIGAAVSFSVTGVIGATSLVLMLLFTGAEGAGVILGTIVALVGISPLAAAIVFVVIGVSTANQRKHGLERLEAERRALIDEEGAADRVPTGPTPSIVLARF